MKRPQRNILLLSSPLIAYVVIRDYLSPNVKFTIGIALLVCAGFLVIVCKDFLVARSKTKKRDWESAIEHYNKFEKSIKNYRQRGINLPIFMSIYTFNGLALTNNNRAQCYMNLQRDEAARTDLECAVALDMLYATPHVNLAILAAQNGDEPVARKELEMAQELGYRSEGAQKLVRMALAKANQAIGDKLS